MLAQGGAVVLGPERAPLLEQRDNLIGERIETAWCDVRHEDEPIAGVVLLVAAAVGVALCRSIARPLRRLESAAARLAQAGIVYKRMEDSYGRRPR